MAAKRSLEITEMNEEPSEQRKKRRTLASAISGVLMMNMSKNLCKEMEPMIRRVVMEEVGNVLKRNIHQIARSSSLTRKPTSLHLKFGSELRQPIFTGSKLLHTDGSNLQVQLVNNNAGDWIPPPNMKVELVVIDGDFPPRDKISWTKEEFEKAIVKERYGKRPLLAGDSLSVSLRNGVAFLGSIEFTDNSSWIRSRRFRIAARVISGGSDGLPVREAITESFIVKDHRGELYKKHHPPSLNDEVWRLEKIGKDGAFHRRLARNHINNVQDFLKLSTVDQPKLRNILGNGMSEKMWEATILHAKTCDLGNKLYVLRGVHFTATLNPICQIVDATIDGSTYTTPQLSYLDKSYVADLAKQGYASWESLEEVTVASESEIDPNNGYLGEPDVEFVVSHASPGIWNSSHSYLNYLY